MRRSLLGFALSLALAWPGVAAPESLGEFRPRPAATLYLIADGQPATLTVSLAQGSGQAPERLLVRLLDPDEQAVGREYLEFAPAVAGTRLFEREWPLPRAGVWQLRLGASAGDGLSNNAVAVALSRPLPWGVSFQNGAFTPWRQEVATAWAYVPPRAELLHLGGGPVVVRDDQGAVLLSAPTDKAPEQTLVVPAADRVWRFDFPQPGHWRFAADGFPLILCPEADTARRLRASIEELPDGTIVAWKFQRRIRELLPSLLAQCGRTADLVRDLRQVREALLADPVRHEILVKSYGGLFLGMNQTLESQCLDPASHWAGSLCGWQEFAAKAPPHNRWDHYQGVEGLWAGISPHSNADKFAVLAALEHPANPWFGRRELFFRTAAAALADLQALKEDETWPGVGAENAYPGMMAFAVGQKTFPPFASAGPQLPSDLRQLWGEALRHIVERSYPDQLVSCRNQSSHYLEAYAAFAVGTGLASDRELARAYNRRFLAGTHPAGFQVEERGPDASYIGMTNWHLAVAYRLLPDPTLLEILKRSYGFFNHTVAPEPDGRMLGGFNFNHRVGDPFQYEQWGGAKGIVSDLLPEVGLWAGQARLTPEQAAAAIAKVLKNDDPAATLNPKLKPFGGSLDLPRWQWWAPPDPSGVWPALEPAPFIRNLGGELIAVKRPAYYTAIYVGHPVPSGWYIRSRESFRQPLSNDVENRGGTPEERKVTPFLGGGMSLFWSPGYGSSLLAACWSPLVHHGLVAVDAQGYRSWEDYFATTWQLDEARGELTLSGKVEKQPLRYVRRYRFDPDRVTVTLTVTADRAATLTRLFENLPLARGPAKARGSRLNLAGDTLQIRDERGAGLDVRFAAPPAATLVENGLQARGLQLGRAEIALPAPLAAGQSVTLEYCLVPVGTP